MKKQKVVMTFMTADLFHTGHLNLLERAADLGDYLVVGIPSSWTIKEHIKGREPIISSEDRLRIVESCHWVDFAFVYTDSEQIDEAIKLMKPDILCRGDDWQDFPGRKAAESIGAKIVFLPYSKGISSTDIRRKICEE